MTNTNITNLRKNLFEYIDQEMCIRDSIGEALQFTANITPTSEITEIETE